MAYLSKTKHKVADITQRIADMEKDMLAISAANSLLLDKTENIVENLQEGNFKPVADLPEDDISSVEWSKKFLAENQIDINSLSIDDLLSEEQLAEIEKEFEKLLFERLEDEYNKKYGCDKIDYAAAAIFGTLSGLIDAVFVGMPKDSMLGNFTDDLADKAVMKFAKLCGWKGPGKPTTSPIKSAIRYLERKFEVKYDQTSSSKISSMYSSNHHLISLSHCPSPLGLICSVINQFTSTSTFISNGKLITIDAETMELRGHNLISKIYAGIINWFGHLMSDMAGSSSSTGRGSGLAIPCTELFLFLNIGSFGKDKRTIAEIAVKMFENGYDFRHGAAMAIPVVTNELLLRFFWMLKRHYKHNMSWKESIPCANNPSVNRMLFVGHGCLCLIDAADAGMRSGGVLLTFLLRTNLLAWARFGFVGLKEINHLANKKTCMLKMEGEHLDRLLSEADEMLDKKNMPLPD